MEEAQRPPKHSTPLEPLLRRLGALALGKWAAQGRVLALGALALLPPALLYLRTCAPSVVVGDSAEFQTEAWRLGVTHPTGYPLYLLLGKAFTLLPFGDVAYRVNLLSVAAALVALGALFAVLLTLTRRPVVAVAAAWLAAAAPALWSQAVIAEVYALQAALVLGALLALVAWNETGRPGWLTLAGLAVGLGLAHHRTIVLLVPAAALYLLLARRPAWRALWPAALAAVAPLLLYLYVPLRWAHTFGRDVSPRQLTDYLLARGYAYALHLSGLRDSARWQATAGLAVRQVTWLGVGLAALGLIALAVRRPRELALTGGAFVAFLLFGLVYQVPDAAVFFIPAWLIVAVWAGVGAAALGDGLLRLARGLPTAAGEAMAVLPLAAAVLLVGANFSALDQSANLSARTLASRALAEPPQSGALVLCDFERLSALRYAFGVERPGLGIEPLMPDTDAATYEQIDRALSTGRPVYLARPLPGVAGRYRLVSEGPLVRVSQAPASAIPPGAQPLDEPFRDGGGRAVVALAGCRLPAASVRRGEALGVTLYWRALFTPDQLPPPYQVQLRLLDAAGAVAAAGPWQQPVAGFNPLNAWLPGEVVADGHWFDVPPTVPPGRYRLQAAWGEPFGGEMLRAPTGSAADVGEVTVLPNPAWRPAPQVRASARFAGGLDLLGYDLRGRPAPGRDLQATLYLRARAPLTDLGLRLALVGPAGEAIATVEAAPFAVAYPPSRWPRGEALAVPLSLRLPEAAPTARARLTLAVLTPEGEPQEARWGLWGRGGAAQLGEVQLDLPPASPGRQVLASFDDRLMLLSYDLSAAEVAPGQPLRVTLRWWAMAPMAEDYTIFVHLLDGAGKVRWQHDGLPAFGTRPTTGWAPGEVVEDVHEIGPPADAPAGSYRLEVGVYSASTWQRLPILDEQGRPKADRLLLDSVQVTR